MNYPIKDTVKIHYKDNKRPATIQVDVHIYATSFDVFSTSDGVMIYEGVYDEDGIHANTKFSDEYVNVIMMMGYDLTEFENTLKNIIKKQFRKVR